MYRPKNKNELMNLVHNERISLKDIDVSLVDDFSYVFYYSKRLDFLGIERWDVSNAKDMSYMFYCCESFNADLSRWNVSKVENMASMFFNCKNFNQDLSKWNT